MVLGVQLIPKLGKRKLCCINFLFILDDTIESENSTNLVSDTTENDTDYSSLSSRLFKTAISRRKMSIPKDCFVVLNRTDEFYNKIEDDHGNDTKSKETDDSVTDYNEGR